MESADPGDDEYRPGVEVLHSLQQTGRRIQHDRARFDGWYLAALRGLLPDRHPLLESPGPALELLDVVLRAVLSGQSPEEAEAEFRRYGERAAAAGVPDDAYPAVGRAIARAARDAAGDAWSSALGSGWSAVHLWMVSHLAAGAARARLRGAAWSAPSPAAAGAAQIGVPVAAPPVAAPLLLVGSGPAPATAPTPTADVAGADAATLDTATSIETSTGTVGDAPDDEPAAGRGRDRTTLRGRRPPADAPDWGNVWGNTEALSNWAFDRSVGRGRPAGRPAGRAAAGSDPDAGSPGEGHR